ncbi:glycine zipper domain-containing protein [Xanthomarina gelatinilytica]|uniref:glycine zipper domain-containing protein n=1 Tax=Xanthomarina gelatinilytica TaxID=1137281 RepID=UPI003AA8D100
MKTYAHPYCPNCGHQFSHKIKYDGQLKGGLSGAVGGALLGGKIGIAMGPLGAIAGTLPGAVLGGVFGKQIGNNIDNPICPKCTFKFTLSDTIRKYPYKLEETFVSNKKLISIDNSKTIQNLPMDIQLLYKQNKSFEIAEILLAYTFEGKDKNINEILKILKFNSPEFAKKTEGILIDLKSRMGL